MTRLRTLGQVMASVLIAVAVAACSHATETRSDVDPRTAAVTTFPGLTPATGDPTLDGIDTQHPERGEIVTVSGPFDDRFEWSELRLSQRMLTGHIEISSDVSELLELEVVAGFYDDAGKFLGTARFVHHLGAAHEDSAHDHVGKEFRITIPARFRAKVTAAAVGVPVLVNE